MDAVGYPGGDAVPTALCAHMFGGEGWEEGPGGATEDAVQEN